MLRHFFLILLLMGLTLLVIIGCQNNIPDIVISPTPIPSDFKVAILLPDLIEESSWSLSGYEGLKLIEKELNAQVTYTEDINQKSIEEVTEIFRKYAQQNYDLIIGHGSGHLTIPSAEIVAQEFPRINFVITESCAGNNANLGCLDFRRDEMGYLIGVVAALKTQTNKITFIGGFDYDTLKEEANSIPLGAKKINPKIQVNIEWLQSWSDEEKALKIAQKNIDVGVDVLILHSDPATIPVNKLAQEKQIWTIPWNVDQYDLAPQAIITSAIFDIPKLLLKSANLVQQGRWQGQQYKFGFIDGVQELAPFRGSLPPEKEDLVKQIQQDIITGKINVLP
jgi:basic membrane protein A and related proteins